MRAEFGHVHRQPDGGDVRHAGHGLEQLHPVGQLRVARHQPVQFPVHGLRVPLDHGQPRLELPAHQRVPGVLHLALQPLNVPRQRVPRRAQVVHRRCRGRGRRHAPQVLRQRLAEPGQHPGVHPVRLGADRPPAPRLEPRSEFLPRRLHGLAPTF